MLVKLERIQKETFVIPLSYNSVTCLEPRGSTQSSHAGYLMFLLKFQNSSTFEPLKITQSLALQKKIDYMDQSDLKIVRQSGTSINLHKLNFPIFADPSRSQL
jgi:FPC/CPF motif-containing protein YcgG